MTLWGGEEGEEKRGKKRIVLKRAVLRAVEARVKF